MPRTARSPPSQTSTNIRSLVEAQSEPSISSISDATLDNNITTRPGKRFRGNGSDPDPDPNTDKFDELKKLLISWKADQDIVLNKLVAEVTELKQQNKIIQKSNSEIEKAITFINKDYEDMKTRVESLEKEFLIRNDLRNDSVVAKLEKKIDTMEQNARMCNIEICNLPDKRNENLLTIIETIGNVIKHPIPHSEVISIHRVPHAQQHDNKPKNVIVTFRSRILRDNILSAYRLTKHLKSDQLGISGTVVPVFLNEHLTLNNKALFRRSREVAKKQGFKFVWIKNATILVREREGLPTIAIRSDNDLAKINTREKTTN